MRVNGKVKQQFIRYIGKNVKTGAVRRVVTNDVKVIEVRRSLDMEVVHQISEKLAINDMIPKNSVVLVYSQLLYLPSNSQGSVGCEVVQYHCYSSVGIGSSYPVKEDVFLLLLLLIHEVYGTPSIYGIEAKCICFVVISFLVLDGLGE